MILLNAMLLAGATPDVSTMETAARPMMKTGELQGCELDFKTVFEDNAYRNGLLSIANGSLLVFGFENASMAPLVSLKLQIFDLTGKVTDWTQSTPIAPASQFLMIDDFKTNRACFVKSGLSDTGGLISVYRFDETFAQFFDRLLSKKSMTVTFNRREGGSDIILPVSFATRSPSGEFATVEFGTCMSNALEIVRKRLRR